MAPKASYEKRDPKIVKLVDFRGLFLELLFGPLAVIRGLLKAVIFGPLFGTLPGTAGRLKFGIPRGMPVKNLASDLHEKDLKTYQKVTPKPLKKSWEGNFREFKNDTNKKHEK